MLHKNCRNAIYAGSRIERFSVPDNFVSWTTPYTGYAPVHYESPVLVGKPWADPAIGISALSAEGECNQYK